MEHPTGFPLGYLARLAPAPPKHVRAAVRFLDPSGLKGSVLHHFQDENHASSQVSEMEGESRH